MNRTVYENCGQFPESLFLYNNTALLLYSKSAGCPVISSCTKNIQFRKHRTIGRNGNQYDVLKIQ